MSQSTAMIPPIAPSTPDHEGDLETALRAQPPANDPSTRSAATTLRRATRAIQERRVCVIRYASEPGGALCTRAIEPLAITTTRGVYGVLAWCRLRRDLRTFRLDRIRELVLASDRYDDHPGLALERFIQQRRRALP